MATARNSTEKTRLPKEASTQPKRAGASGTGNDKQKALKSGPSSVIAPKIRSVNLSAIVRIHDAVPEEWVGAFLIELGELGDPRVLSVDALKHLLLQHPIGVVPTSGKRRKKTKDSQQQFAVVTGLATWTALQRNLKESPTRVTEGDKTALNKSSRINVIDFGQIEDRKRISDLAKMDAWLSLAMHLPANKVRDAVYAKAQKEIRNLIAKHTPQLRQQNYLADALGKSRSSLTKKKVSKGSGKKPAEPS